MKETNRPRVICIDELDKKNEIQNGKCKSENIINPARTRNILSFHKIKYRLSKEHV
ncbi:MAG: hypothetical protein WA667_12225 [Candidatus Nitrosopolaris sp.]